MAVMMQAFYWNAPIDGQKRWTNFDPKSGIFPRDYNHFHPSRYECVMIEGGSATSTTRTSLCSVTALNMIRHAFSVQDAPLTVDRASSVRFLRVIGLACPNTEL